jgi:hypothetical protein
MDRISAADNLTIEMQTDRWRLLVNGDREERTVVEAQPGKPLRYIPGFGKSRRLPDNGTLPVEHIQRVVVGWSNQDESWHLGLVLGAELAQARGSRWCEVARWPDPEVNIYNELASRAGEALAQAVTRPFYLVPAQVEEKSAPANAASRPLPELPLTLPVWTFSRSGDQLQLVRSRSQSLAAIRRILWYTLWTIIYIVLVVTSFTAGIAPAKPDFLPYLGIVSAVMLVVLIISNIYHLLVDPNRIVIDPATRTIKALRGRRTHWSFSADKLQSVYVTLVTSKINMKKADPKQHFHYAEINLQLANGKFHDILDSEQSGTFTPVSPDVENEEAVIPLISDNTYTDFQAVGVYIAEALNLPCWYDRRF